MFFFSSVEPRIASSRALSICNADKMEMFERICKSSRDVIGFERRERWKSIRSLSLLTNNRSRAFLRFDEIDTRPLYHFLHVIINDISRNNFFFMQHRLSCQKQFSSRCTCHSANKDRWVSRINNNELQTSIMDKQTRGMLMSMNA